MGSAVTGFPVGGHIAAGDPPITPTLAWYDADDLDTLTLDANGLVTAWADKSGNGYHAAAAGSPATLTLTSFPTEDNVRAARAAIFLDALNSQRLTTSCPWGQDSSSSAFIAGCCQDLVQYRTLLDSASNGNQWVLDGATHQTFRAGVGLLGAQGNASVTQAKPTVFGQLMAATSVRHYLNLTNESDAHASAVSAGNMTIGGGSNHWHGWIAEILVYNTTLSTGDAATVIAYLMDKWGIS